MIFQVSLHAKRYFGTIAGVQIMQMSLFLSVLINTVYSHRMGGNCSVQEYARYLDWIARKP